MASQLLVLVLLVSNGLAIALLERVVGMRDIAVAVREMVNLRVDQQE